MTQKRLAHNRPITDDLKTVFTPSSDGETFIFLLLWVIGGMYGLFTVGALYGFRVGYRRLRLKHGDEVGPPWLHRQPLAVYISMAVWAIVFLFLPVILLSLYGTILGWFTDGSRVPGAFLIGYAGANLLITLAAMVFFRKWREADFQYFNESGRHGTARFAYDSELEPYTFTTQKALDSGFGGMRIGPAHDYFNAGHILTVAGTRGGKGVNLLVPALLKINPYQGSWVIIDPKGELAAITAKAQYDLGRKVVILDPWEMFGANINSPFNPLDILKRDKLNLADDVQLIAECIVPSSAGGDGDHFNNRARALISGFLLHLVTGQKVKADERHLGTLWAWLRLPAEEWDKLLVDMIENNDPGGGEIVQAAANEILALMEKGEKEFASVISTAQKWTDFLKSPALRQSLNVSKNFTPADLTQGKTTVYLVIPSDRLKTHYQWLRLAVSSLMRYVIRNPQNDVTFMLDEFYALGYLSEIEVALGSYAGYGVHVWAVLQNLVQLHDQYGDNWENFISSCSVRHFFNIADNFSADYIAKLFGTVTVPKYDAMGKVEGSTGRMLVNPDELRRESGNVIYALIDNLNPAIFQKWPYYKMPSLVEGVDYMRNPYQDRLKNKRARQQGPNATTGQGPQPNAAQIS